MEYIPKIVKGTVKDTGWPIDGHTLYFSLWDYDNHSSWHLYGWDEQDDAAVMETLFITEAETGVCRYETLKAFAEAWKSKVWKPSSSFCLSLDQVDVVEVMQHEVTNPTRSKLRERGFDLTPRKYSDKGGILCLPLDKNLNGDTQKKHPDWELITCPACGQKCWKIPGADKLQREQGVLLLCTECAVKAGFVRPYGHMNKNRAQRREAKRNAGR